MATPVVAFDSKTHTYHVGRREYPSVTRILRAAGLTSAFYREGDSRARGDAVHKAGRLICEGRYDEQGTHPTIIPFARGIQEFVDKMQYKTLAPSDPLPMVSVRMGYAGTPDDWGVVKTGEVWLIDWKSGQSMPGAVGVQLAAYRELIREYFPELGVNSLRCVHIDAAGKTVWPAFDEPRWKSGWASALNCYNLRKDLGLLGKSDR